LRIVALLIVGNSSDILAGCIEHHRAMGVDEFVILHIHSDDDTPDQLEKLARESSSIHPVFASHQEAIAGHTVFASHAEALAGSIYESLLDRIRRELRPDWIMRLDCDERWMVKDGTLKDTLARVSSDTITVPRYNAVWPSDAASREVGRVVLSADVVPVAADPVAVDFPTRHILDVVPWVLTKVGPKSCIRARAEISFDTGGHYGLDQTTRRTITGPCPPDLLIAQLPFTVRERFERKLRTLASLWTVLRKGVPESQGWHWDRLARIHDQGEDAIRTEWQRQFMTPAFARDLVGRDVIRRAVDTFGG
jgi:hypothetical protein